MLTALAFLLLTLLIVALAYCLFKFYLELSSLRRWLGRVDTAMYAMKLEFDEIKLKFGHIEEDMVGIQFESDFDKHWGPIERPKISKQKVKKHG
jgi:hypothetical protein